MLIDISECLDADGLLELEIALEGICRGLGCLFQVDVAALLVLARDNQRLLRLTRINISHFLRFLIRRWTFIQNTILMNSKPNIVFFILVSITNHSYTSSSLGASM